MVDCKNGTIYSKEPIPLDNKVYLTDGTYLGLVVKCFMVDNFGDNIHEITLDDTPEIMTNMNIHSVSLEGVEFNENKQVLNNVINELIQY